MLFFDIVVGLHDNILNQNMKKISILLFIFLFTSCASQKKISYFQDIQFDSVFATVEGNDITLRPDDMLSIVVSSKIPELAMLFNLPIIQQIAGTDGKNGRYSQQELSGYTVDSRGNIDFPVLGEINVVGLTKEEVAVTIKDALISSDLIKDPIITINFINLQFSVLGEVSKPGRYNINKNRTTILEALSMAGDLTIYGERDRVFVIRNENGSERITYQLDLRTQDIYQSPAFYIQQNDLIYVEPNKIKANQSTVNGNAFRSTSFWISLASLLTTLTVLFIK